MIRFTCGPLVRFLRTTAGAIGARLSLRPSFLRRVKLMQASGASRRENGSACLAMLSVVIVRLDRTTQYSRDAE